MDDVAPRFDDRAPPLLYGDQPGWRRVLKLQPFDKRPAPRDRRRDLQVDGAGLLFGTLTDVKLPGGPGHPKWG